MARDNSIFDQNDLAYQLAVAQDEADDANEACTILYGALVAVAEFLEQGETTMALETAQDAMDMVHRTDADE